MQLFPAVSTAIDLAASFVGQDKPAKDSSGGFQDMMSSFIKEGRTDYTGRPAGFSGFGPKSGTIDDDTGSQISKALRKRNVSEETVDRLEALMASGAPVTMGTICTALSAKSRLTEPLEGAERDDFKMLLGKLGFSKDEQDELLALTDSGDTNDVWKTLSEKFKNLDSTADVSKKEWGALLKGLDITSGTKADLLKVFGDAEDQTLSGGQLEALLAGVNKEFAARNKAALHARGQMRDAVAEVLAQSKQREQNAPVQDTRGSRRSEQTEELMHNSVRKNTGSDQIKQDLTQSQSGHDDLENGRDGQSRSERILATDADDRLKKHGPREAGTEKSVEKSAEKIADKLLQRIDVAADTATPANTSSTAQNLNSLAQGHRREIFSQVEQGILHNAANGSQKLTLQLNPAELGQVTVILSVHQGELRATIRADQQDSADVLKGQLVELKASLEAEGLKVKELDVQTNLQDNNLAGRWDGHQEHNLMRDANERDRLLRLSRVRREGAGGGAAREGSSEAPDHVETAGLHIVA